jgi:Ti-type conjugative transfer relaxase TraA
MLSIGGATAGYYMSLARDDYYHKGTEPAGIWYGKGAEAFGLSGQVDRQTFLALCAGFRPEDLTQRLVQNAGRENRRSGWDLCFSAPKSVSALWALSDDVTREKISAANYSAVLHALDFMQEHFGFTRIGNDGTEVEKCQKLFFALFEHSTSRAQDPQLHIHAVMVNLGINESGETRSLQTQHLFEAKMLLGALYRAQLAYQLRAELGVEIEQGKKGAFEIKGEFKGLIEDWSTRREEIEKAMKVENATGAKRAAHFTLKTREKKENINREELFAQWQKEGQARGVDYTTAIERKAFRLREGKRRLEKAMPQIVEELTKDRAYFTEATLLRKVAEVSPLYDASLDDARKVTSNYLEREAVHLCTDKTQKVYTTHEIDQLEKKMLATVEAGRSKIFPTQKSKGDYTIPKKLSDEQRQALIHICEEAGAIKCVSGMAGTGKTTLLSAANGIWKAKGYEVKGASLAAVAAQGLQDGSGIQSQTVARLLFDIERAQKEGKPLPLSKETVLVVDEAGMIGTRQMAKLIESCDKAGAKLVLIGDEKQLQPIEHGAPFKAIGNVLGRSELKGIFRQKEEWAREAVYSVAGGRSESALEAFAAKGMLTVKDTKEDAIVSLIEEWKRDATDQKEKLILSTTRQGAKALNQMAQAERMKRGELKGEALTFNGYEFYAGDRVIFTKNQKNLGLLNGQTGTIRTINERAGTLGVALDSGELRIVQTSGYQNVELGYATTTHKAQGKTVDRAYVLAGGWMQDKEISYVQISRAREATRLYTSVEEAGRTIEEIAAKMNQSRVKELAQEQRQHIEPERQQERQRGLSR